MVDKSTVLPVRTDLQQAFRLPFFLSVIGLVLCFCFDNWTSLENSIGNPLVYSENSITCVHYFFFNSFSFGGVFISYFACLLSAIPFSTSYCIEQYGGITTYKTARCGKRQYALSKILVSALSGGAVFSVGSLIFILGLSTYLPLVTSQKLEESVWIPYYNALAAGNGVPYFMIMLYITFLSGALWSCFGLCISAFFPSPYIAACSPLIIRFLIVQIGRILKLPDNMRIDRIMTARGTVCSDIVTLILLTSVVILLIRLCYKLFLDRMSRRLENAE